MKRLIEIKVNLEGGTCKWDTVFSFLYHASSEEEANHFTDILASYNKAQIRWNWFGSTLGHYSRIYYGVNVYA